jgi:hypothetical protein
LVRLEAIARQWESLKSCGRGIAVSQNVVQTFLFAALGTHAETFARKPWSGAVATLGSQAAESSVRVAADCAQVLLARNPLTPQKNLPPRATFSLR